MSWDHCSELIEGQECGRESCATVHQVSNEQGGHDFREVPHPQPYRDGKVHVMASKCSTCIFRPGNLMHLQEGRVEDMVRSCIEENTVIPCHQTLDGPRAVCRGLWDVHRINIPILRMAVAFNVTAYEDPPEDH